MGGSHEVPGVEDPLDEAGIDEAVGGDVTRWNV